LFRRINERPGALIRNTFIGRTPEEIAANSDRVPPLAQILKSGRGNDARLKLELSMLWVAVSGAFETRDPARLWASLLGLDPAPSRGPRQVLSALGWLERNHLVALTPRKGHETVVRMLNDDGSGRPYSPPNPMIDRNDPNEKYVRLPSTFWLRGWVQVLSAPAVAMLLIFMHHHATRGKPKHMLHSLQGDGLWLARNFAADRYVIIDDTRYKGIAELNQYGLVASHRQAVPGRRSDQQRFRSVHRLHLDLLELPPHEARRRVQQEEQALAERRRNLDGLRERVAQANAELGYDPDEPS